MVTVTQTCISNAAYERLALDDHDRKWELRNGCLREKPGMTAAHNQFQMNLGFMLMSQLDGSVYDVRIGAGRVRCDDATYLIPDVFVVPSSLVTPLLDLDDVLEVYAEPLPLVVEIWSRSTGAYDVREKLAVYQQRGDREIWCIHPDDRTLTVWVRQPDGRYTETVHHEGVVAPATLPGVSIDLDQLFTR